MSVLKRVLVLSLSLVFAFCSKDTRTSRLDDEYGFNGLVLGDSLYAEFLRTAKQQAGEDRGFEKEVLGHTISGLVEFERVESRFVFDLVMDETQARAVDGRLGYFSLSNATADSARKAAFIDSLVHAYGPPTEIVDSTSSDALPFQVRSWSGEHVKLQVMTQPGGQGLWLTVKELSTEAKLADIDSTISALANAGHEQLESLETVGSIPLNAMVGTLVERGLAVRREIGGLASNYVFVTYDVEYKNVKGFFDLTLRASTKYSRNPHASVYVEEPDERLSTLVVWFPKNRLSFGDCVTAVGRRVGKHDLIVREFVQGGINRAAYWVSKDLTISVEEDENNVEVTFDVQGGSPRGLFYF